MLLASYFLNPKLKTVALRAARFAHQQIQSLPFYIVLLNVLLVGLRLPRGSVLIPALSATKSEQ
jgi:hypothetical protein